MCLLVLAMKNLFSPILDLPGEKNPDEVLALMRAAMRRVPEGCQPLRGAIANVYSSVASELKKDVSGVRMCRVSLVDQEIAGKFTSQTQALTVTKMTFVIMSMSKVHELGIS